MKKFISIVLFSLALTGIVFGQGTVVWTGFAGTVTVQTNTSQSSPIFNDGFPVFGGTQGSIAPGGPNYYFALLYSTYVGSQAPKPTNSVMLSGWQFAGLMATNSSIAGRITAINPSTAATVPWAAGVTNSILLVGWSANAGSTWLQASNNFFSNFGAISGPVFFGVSETGYLAPGSSNPGVSVFGSSANATGLPINGINTQLFIAPIPEPSGVALCALGAFSLMQMLRRK